MSYNPFDYQHPAQPMNYAPYNPASQYTTDRIPHLSRGATNDTRYSPRDDGGYQPRPPPRSIIGDTRSLYNDDGSEMSFDTSYEAPFTPPSSVSTASTGHSSVPTPPPSTPFNPANTTNSYTVVPLSTTAAPPQISLAERDLVVKRYNYYSSRARSFTDAKDYVNAEECCTRALEKRVEALAAIVLLRPSPPFGKREWRRAGFCAFMASIALLGENNLEEAMSQARELLELSSGPESPSSKHLGIMGSFEYHAHRNLAIIMAKKGDMLEAEFYKSLVPPVPATLDKGVERLFELFEQALPFHFKELWESIK
ncbi:hypothetical protein TWF281_003707 [Arthrobotrys megalospora]